MDKFDRPGYKIKVPTKDGREETVDEALHDVLHGEEVISHPVSFVDKIKSLYTKHRKLFWLGSGVLGLLIVVFVGYMIITRGGQGYTGRHVTLSVDATTQINSGESVEYTINYLNEEAISLQDTKLYVTYPHGFELTSVSEEALNDEGTQWDLGTLKKDEGGKIIVSGKLPVEPDSIQTVEVALEFSPVGVSSLFEEIAKADTLINPSALVLRILAPETVADGNNIKYDIEYENEGDEAMNNVELRLEYPSTFVFGEATPVADEGDNVWTLGNVGAGETGSIEVTGILSGDLGSHKQINTEIGSLNSAGEFALLATETSSTQIASMDILITQTVQNEESTALVDPGSVLRYNLEYTNNSGVSLHNVTIESHLTVKAIDETSIEITGDAGSYSNGVVTWNSSGVEDLVVLAPGDSGILGFSVEIPDVLTINSPDDKNFKVEGQAFIKSADIPVGISQDRQVASNITTAKVETVPIITSLPFYYDIGTGDPVGTGPHPPQVGKSTVYRVYWQVKNKTHDLRNNVVSAKLAPGVEWAGGSVVSHGENLVYNETSSQVTWTVGMIPANTGFLTDEMEASFLVRIIPGANLAGSPVPLVQKTAISGVDSFTQQDMESSAAAIDSTLLNDPSAGENGRVAQ